MQYSKKEIIVVNILVLLYYLTFVIFQAAEGY